jgi:hypothetical protein
MLTHLSSRHKGFDVTDETLSDYATNDVTLQEQQQVVVIEDSDAEQKRKLELEERIRAQEMQVLSPSGSPRSMIAEATKHLGYRESGNNETKFNWWLGRIQGYPHNGYGYPWCHSFVSYCLWHSNNIGTGPRTAGCTTGVAWFKSRGRWHSTPRAGDLVYYGANGGTHVELVTAVNAGTIRTIGGNTSGSLGGNFFNGNGVYAKTVNRSSSRIHGYGRPSYESGTGGETSVTPITSIRSVREQQKAVNGLGYTPKLVVDNEWGPKSEAGVKWLQKLVGTTADGQWGPNTEAKYLAHIGRP